MNLEIVKDKSSNLSKGFAFFSVRKQGEAQILEQLEVHIRGRCLRPERRDKKTSKTSPSRIFVGGIPSTFSNQKLSGTFRFFGPVKTAYIIRGRYNSKSLGFGYVDFNSAADAKTALDQE